MVMGTGVKGSGIEIWASIAVMAVKIAAVLISLMENFKFMVTSPQS
jgi:hypothetical protein